jgi:hypothetical protein
MMRKSHLHDKRRCPQGRLQGQHEAACKAGMKLSAWLSAINSAQRSLADLQAFPRAIW